MQNHFLFAIVNSRSYSIVFGRPIYSNYRNKENIQSRFICYILPKIYENLFGKHIIYFWHTCFSENTYICISGMRAFLTYLYTSNMAGAQLRGRRRGGGRPPLPYFENRKKVPWFCKKCPDCVHILVKFFIQNVILRVYSRKNSRIFSCGAFFSSVFDKMFIKVP